MVPVGYGMGIKSQIRGHLGLEAELSALQETWSQPKPHGQLLVVKSSKLPHREPSTLCSRF